MQKEFIPYEQALALKELGFDEPCFAVYIDKTLIMEDDWLYSTNQDTFIESSNFTISSSSQGCPILAGYFDASKPYITLFTLVMVLKI